MIRAFEVRPVLNGYIVSIGCQKLVYNDREALVGVIDMYLKAPEEVEKTILRTSCNAEFILPEEAPPTGPDHPRGMIGRNPVSPEAIHGQEEAAQARPGY